jgi:hypothetical protein
MLKWFRTRASATAPLLLLSLAALALPHADRAQHDADGAFALLAVHDATGHGVGAPASDEGDQGHCAICHLSRPFRPLTQTALVGLASTQTVRASHIDDFTAARSDTAAQPPLRAPPDSPEIA